MNGLNRQPKSLSVTKIINCLIVNSKEKDVTSFL